MFAAEDTTDRITGYAYDNSGHVTRVGIDEGADSVTDTVVAIDYDAAGAPTRRSVTTSAGATLTTYDYDGLPPVRVSQGSPEGTETVRVGYDEGGSAWIVSYTASDATDTVDVFPLTNERGDILALADEDGAVVARYRYSEWGDVEGVTASASALIDADTASRIAHLQPLRFAGYMYEEASGLYLTGARAYDPRTAQFLSKDPEKADGEQSAYQYCGGDPVSKLDSGGTRARWIGKPVPDVWFTQGDANVCWCYAIAAVVQLVTSSQGITPDVVKSDAHNIGIDSMRDAFDIAKVLGIYLAGARGHEYRVRAVTLRHFIKTRRPVIAELQDALGGGHCIVIDQITTDLKNVKWFDPFDHVHHQCTYRYLLRRAFYRVQSDSEGLTWEGVVFFGR